MSRRGEILVKEKIYKSMKERISARYIINAQNAPENAGIYCAHSL